MARPADGSAGQGLTPRVRELRSFRHRPILNDRTIGTMAETRPNILWYCTDQQRFDTNGALGTPYVATPTLDRLVAVTDALDQKTTYTYDEVGNRLTQSDANGKAVVVALTGTTRQNVGGRAQQAAAAEDELIRISVDDALFLPAAS